MRYLIILGVLFTVACGHFDNNPKIRPQKNLKTKEATFVVIKPVDNPKAIGLSSDEIDEVNKIYFQCISDNKEFLRSSDDYKRQYVPIINNQGGKEVWVNCFCSQEINWETDIISVEDGGKCYFNFQINLKTKKYYNLRVNGKG